MFQVEVHNILGVLSELLKQHPENDGIHGRVFRIVGNMGHHWDRFSSTILTRKPELMECLRNYLQKCAADEDGDCSDGTIMMGIRAFR